METNPYVENSLDIEIKQNYLREEVMELGYNTDDFLKFLILKKGENAADLSIWNLDELVNVVKEYKSLTQDNITSGISANEQNTSIKETSSDLTQWSLINKVDLLQSPTYDEIITCIKQDKTPLTDILNVKITISK